MKTKRVIENKQEKNNDITAELKLFSLHEERLKLEEELLEIETLLKGANVYEDLESKTIKTNNKILNTMNQQKNGMRMNNEHTFINICICICGSMHIFMYTHIYIFRNICSVCVDVCISELVLIYITHKDRF